ncbi:MAG: MarR family transcriptional regulator [Erysipelotrichaceae bacterium]|nr:MarR family transcriptional regulator [Erysipelotrichaceae bacterium]
MDKLDLAGLLIKCSQVLNHKMGKKQGQGRILEILNERDTISQKELQDILNIKAGSISEILSKLEKSGKIIRYKDNNDKRKSVIQITDKGRNTITHYQNNNEDIFFMLDDNEKEQLSYLLNKILISWKERRKGNL